MFVTYILLGLSTLVTSQQTTDNGFLEGVLKNMLYEIRKIGERSAATQSGLAAIESKLTSVQSKLSSVQSKSTAIEKKDDCKGLQNYIEDLTANQALISGPIHWVPEAAFDSSSNAFNKVDHGPTCSRLYVPKPDFCGSWGWAAGNLNGWIQVDLGRDFSIIGVATRGRGDDPFTTQYVTRYKMAKFTPNTNSVVYYQNQKIFTGNIEPLMIVHNTLNPSLNGRYIRLYPVEFNTHATLRWELYGQP